MTPPPHAVQTLLVFASLGRQHNRTHVPRYQKSGSHRCPLLMLSVLFDIVGFDEGTCGRRPRVRQLLGVECSVKLSRYLQCPTHHVRFVQVSAPRNGSLRRGLFLRAVG